MIVAIDVGTTKICVLIAKQAQQGIEILGMGKSTSYGLARGVVVDIAQAVHAIRAALKEAELMAGIQVESAIIGISGSHIRAINTQGMVPIRGTITADDIAQVIAAARAIPIPEGQQLLHALPQLFIIDSHHRVHDPLGMHGIRLEAHVHLITGAISSVQDLVRCVELAGVKVEDIVLEPLASAHAVLSDDEKKLGVAILDIGGGTADLAIYQDGTIRHTHVIPIAGNMFTQDIALCLRTTIKDAERIKRQFGAVHPSHIATAGHIEFEMAHEQQSGFVEPIILYEILESRIHELLNFVRAEIESHNLRHFIPAGLVLTGGGSLLRGMQQRAQEILHIPVRIGLPRVPHLYQQMLEHPMYATSYGLLRYTLDKRQNPSPELFTGSSASRIFHRMKSWVFDFF